MWTLSLGILSRAQRLASGFIFALTICCAFPAQAKENVGPSDTSNAKTRSGGACGDHSMFSKADIEGFAKKVHGSKADCYMKLYNNETGGNPVCKNQKVPNPPGVGICMLEGNENLRKRRGGACAVSNADMDGKNETSIENQMKCCASIMKKVGDKYFEGVKKGKLQNCETGSTAGGGSDDKSSSKTPSDSSTPASAAAAAPKPPAPPAAPAAAPAPVATTPAPPPAITPSPMTALAEKRATDLAAANAATLKANQDKALAQQQAADVAAQKRSADIAAAKLQSTKAAAAKARKARLREQMINNGQDPDDAPNSDNSTNSDGSGSQ